MTDEREPEWGNVGGGGVGDGSGDAAEHPLTPPTLPPMSHELEGIPPVVELPPSPTEAFVTVPGPLGLDESSALDSLFGETKFVEYDEGPSVSENPFTKKPVDAAVAHVGASVPAEAGRKPQPVLLWVAGSLVAVLALGALFMLGTKLPALLGPAPGALVTPTSTPSPTPTEVPLGPVEPGEYQWDALLGGECLDPYEGPWQNKYTVVDCEKPHAAQLVTRAKFAPLDGVTGYPGVEVLHSQVNLLCTSPTGVDYGKANAYTDLQFEASYGLSEQDWNDGNQFYNCYLSRSAGGEITGTIAVPQVAPPPAPSEEPVP